MFKLTPEQLVKELYGAPPAAGQKRLEDFKKKNIPKPEGAKGAGLIVNAENEKGEPVVFDLEEIKNNMAEMLDGLNLPELSEAVRDAEISLTAEQIEKIQSMAEEGYSKMMLMPAPELQNEYLAKIKTETEKEMPGLQAGEQYSQEGAYLWDDVKSEFPNGIKTTNRTEGKAYLLFLKDSQEVPDDTRGKSADEMRATLDEQGKTGLTLPEYLLIQREFAEKHKNDDPQAHMDRQYATWLLDSRLPSGRVLRAGWYPDDRRVRVYSDPSDHQHSPLGCRSSAVLPL